MILTALIGLDYYFQHTRKELPGEKMEKETLNLKCSVCGSEDVRRLSLIHEMGVSEIKASTVGVGASAEGLGLGVAATSGISQTLLAERAAPPRKISLMQWAFACGIVFFVFVEVLPGWLALPVGAAIVLGGIWLLHRFHNINQKEHPEKLRRWKNSFMCLRCGNLYESENRA